MTPVIPLADPLPQPAPQWLLWSLLQLTFFLHVLAMNVVLGGSILALHWRVSRRREGAAPRAEIVAAFGKGLPVAVAAAVTLGVAPLLLVQVLYGRLFLTSSILMAWWWLAVVPLVTLAYYGAYVIAFRGAALGRWATAIATAVTLLFAGVALLYTSNVTRSLRPDTFVEIHSASARGLILNLSDPTFWPRYLHMLLGAVAVASLAAALFGYARRRESPELASWVARRSAVMFSVATALNIVVGTWFLLAQPKEILIRLVGGDTWAMTVLAVAILLGVATGGVALLALGARSPGRATWGLLAVLLPTLVVMVLLRDQVRQLALRHAGFESPSWVEPQWGPVALFATLLVVAMAVITGMARALVRGTPAGAATASTARISPAAKGSASEG